MSTPQSTPVHLKLGIVSAKSSPLTNEYKRLLGDQHQRLSLKHQQDLDLLDDIRSYMKARLSIEKDYTCALQKLAKQHTNHINKKFTLLNQLDQPKQQQQQQQQQQQKQNDLQLGGTNASANQPKAGQSPESHNNQPEFDAPASETASRKPNSLYRVWSDHVQKIAATVKNQSDQFEQLNLVVDKLKDIRQHKASIGKRCLETHLKRIQEDLLLSLMDVERAKKLYYEDESQARKARENEERIKKKRTGLLTKFTDLQAKKERSSAQREATDIQSTQARNDYIMALAAANAHLRYYFQQDLQDFIHLIDDGALDQCKLFMTTLSECEINSLKESLSHAQSWSRQINLTGSQQTNCIFLTCDQSKCLRTKQELTFEACNQDQITGISLEHNADYALQHEIDKWFTWFKKECHNLSQLMHQLDTCRHAYAEGKKSIELNGQTIEDLEPKIIELRQLIRKCEAAKLKAQARLKVIKEGGMQFEEWAVVESEIRADAARAQEEIQRAQRLKEMKTMASMDALEGAIADPSTSGAEHRTRHQDNFEAGVKLRTKTGGANGAIQVQVSRDSDSSEPGFVGAELSSHNLASVSKSTSNLQQRQQNAISNYAALADHSLVWQDSYSGAWGASMPNGSASSAHAISASCDGDDEGQEQQLQQQQKQQQPITTIKSPTSPQPAQSLEQAPASTKQMQQIPNATGAATTAMSIQSSSPLSAIVNGGQHLSQSPYHGLMSEAYKSDYECDYARTGQHASIRSAASSAEFAMSVTDTHAMAQRQPDAAQLTGQQFDDSVPDEWGEQQDNKQEIEEVLQLLNRRVVALYPFEKSNEDDLALREADVLLVIETNAQDPDWVKARNETTGEQGFIPASYVQLLDDYANQISVPAAEEQQQQQQRAADRNQSCEMAKTATLCRALYDYTPEADTYEADGLPCLALRQGEMMHVLDQGQDDGWWLVERHDEERTRGHVPSMLVEEVDSLGDCDPEDDYGQLDECDDGLDDDGGGEHDDELVNSDLELVAGSEPPSMEPPPPPPPEVDECGAEKLEDEREQELKLELELEDEREHNYEHEQEIAGPSRGPLAEDYEKATEEVISSAPATSASNSLIPTSFIIIEPTPEIESRRFEDNLPGTEDSHRDGHKGDTDVHQDVHLAQDDKHGDGEGEVNNSNERTPPRSTQPNQTGRRIIQTKQPPGQVSYSVVNEEFVLEKPTRKPYQHQQITSDPCEFESVGDGLHEPTIVEDENENVDDQIGSQRQHGQYYVTPIDYSNIPAPPEVVIDAVEAIPRSPDLSFDDDEDAVSSGHTGSRYENADDDDDDEADGDGNLSNCSPASSERSRSFKHSGFVDVSPILRHHAEEFCKQLIEEAIMLAPGSRIGPSTSSASVTDEPCGGHNSDFDEEETNYSLEDS